MGKEKRKFRRLPIRGFMKCGVDFDIRGKRLDGVDVLSLSAGGMFIAIDEQHEFFLKEGDTLTAIQFDLDGLNDLELAGCIAHRMSLGEIGGCGVEFEPVNPPNLERLETFVSRKLAEFGLGAI